MTRLLAQKPVDRLPVERRMHKQLQLRVRRAAFRSDKTFTLESFDFSFNPIINRQQVLTYRRQLRARDRQVLRFGTE